MWDPDAGRNALINFSVSSAVIFPSFNIARIWLTASDIVCTLPPNIDPFVAGYGHTMAYIVVAVVHSRTRLAHRFDNLDFSKFFAAALLAVQGLE